MIRLIPFSVCIWVSAVALAKNPLPAPHFLATVQFAVEENDARRVPEEQSRIRVYFTKTLEGWPQLQTHPLEVRTVGNEIVFYFTSDTNLHEPMQEALSLFVHNLNGKVRMRGRAEVSSLSEPMAGYRVEVDKARTRLQGASARAAPLRDLLKDIKKQLVAFSYSIPGSCGNVPIHWNFVPSPDPKVDSVKEAMAELASLTGLRLNAHKGDYFEFTGHCAPVRQAAERLEGQAITLPQPNVFFAPTAESERPYVYVPLRMLSE